jgi:Txe/YoeB family toxin of Txe-Axe toxin-antitoxin module
MRILKPSEVVFCDDKIEKEFNNLKENEEIKRFIQRAIEDIKQNAFCGIQIPKRLFPREYVQKYQINNLWKYDLPDGWRLIYFIQTPNKVQILAVILEWFNHNEYERRFHY